MNHTMNWGCPAVSMFSLRCTHQLPYLLCVDAAFHVCTRGFVMLNCTVLTWQLDCAAAKMVHCHDNVAYNDRCRPLDEMRSHQAKDEDSCRKLHVLVGLFLRFLSCNCALQQHACLAHVLPQAGCCFK